MKKGKVFTKKHIVLAVMVLSLGVAVWLNMKFSSEKYLGEATFVSNNSAVENSAKSESEDYFETAKKDREKAKTQAEEVITEALKKTPLTDADKKKALSLTEALTKRIESESNIETLLKAKGFSKALAVIGENNITVVVKSEGLTTAQTLQIQDIVTEETKIPLGNIKIVIVK